MGKVSENWPHPLAKAEAEGCCGNAEWRGYLCPFHDGVAWGIELYEDNLDKARETR